MRKFSIEDVDIAKGKVKRHSIAPATPLFRTNTEFDESDRKRKSSFIRNNEYYKKPAIRGKLEQKIMEIKEES